MMKRMLALALAVVMLLAVVLTVSAEEKEEIFDEVDARDLYDGQAIVIPEEAKNVPVVTVRSRAGNIPFTPIL